MINQPASDTAAKSVSVSEAATGTQLSVDERAKNGTALIVFGRKLGVFFLGNEYKQRIRIIQSLLSSLVFLICTGLIVYLTSIHIMDPIKGWILSGGILTSNLFFYLFFLWFFYLYISFYFNFPFLFFPIYSTLISICFIFLSFSFFYYCPLLF